jgi:hypothetical protein
LAHATGGVTSGVEAIELERFVASLGVNPRSGQPLFDADSQLVTIDEHRKPYVVLGFEQMAEKGKNLNLQRTSLALDPLAESALQTEPAFIARLAGAIDHR